MKVRLPVVTLNLPKLGSKIPPALRGKHIKLLEMLRSSARNKKNRIPIAVFQIAKRRVAVETSKTLLLRPLVF
jgi:hypothetical protein